MPTHLRNEEQIVVFFPQFGCDETIQISLRMEKHNGNEVEEELHGVIL